MVPPHSPRPGRPLCGAAGAPPIVTGAWIVEEQPIREVAQDVELGFGMESSGRAP